MMMQERRSLGFGILPNKNVRNHQLSQAYSAEYMCVNREERSEEIEKEKDACTQRNDRVVCTYVYTCM